jgi:hypothetical protein
VGLAFFGLHVKEGLGREVGKIRDAQSVAPEFASEEFDHFRCGDSLRGLVFLPAGVGQGALAVRPVGGMGSQLKVGVGGGDERGDQRHGCFRPDVGFSHAEDGFFVAEVNLDSPAPEVGLEEFFERRVGADQIGRLSVEDVGLFGEAILQRGDDDKAKVLFSGASPAHGGEGFDSELVFFPGGPGRDRHPGESADPSWNWRPDVYSMPVIVWLPRQTSVLRRAAQALAPRGQAFGASPCSLLPEGRSGLVPDGVEMGDYPRRFFFSADGGTCNRRSTS